MKIAVICKKPTKTLTKGRIYYVIKELKDSCIRWGPSSWSDIKFMDMYLIMNDYGQIIRVSKERFTFKK